MSRGTNKMLTKRERLNEAFAQLVESRALADISIAEIAEVANVPLGNVYYYYKTKAHMLNSFVSTLLEEIFNQGNILEGLQEKQGRHALARLSKVTFLNQGTTDQEVLHLIDMARDAMASLVESSKAANQKNIISLALLYSLGIDPKEIQPC